MRVYENEVILEGRTFAWVRSPLKERERNSCIGAIKDALINFLTSWTFTGIRQRGLVDGATCGKEDRSFRVRGHVAE